MIYCWSQILHKLEGRDAGLERLYDMDEKEIGALIRHPNGGKVIHLIYA
jgi:activating signal cointegrator complex subunit 3